MALAQNVQAVQSRLAHYYLEKLRSLQRMHQRGGDSVYAALNQFEQEWPQIQHWQAWAAAHAQVNNEAAVLCSEFPEAANNLLDLRQNTQERIQWLETGLAAARQITSQNGEINILLTLARCHEQIGDMTQAESYAQLALALAYQAQDQRRLAHAFQRLGVLALNKGNTTPATDFAEQALAIFQSLSDHQNMAECLHFLGIIRQNLGQHEVAHDLLEQCVTIRQRLGDVGGMGSTLFVLGNGANYQGDYVAARDYYERGLTLSRAVGNKTFVAGGLNSLGNIADVLGDQATARRYYEEALAIYEEMGSRIGSAMVSGNLGFIAAAQGDDVAARHYNEIALDAFRATGYIPYVMLALANLTPILIRLGDVQRAIRVVHEGVSLVNSNTGRMQVTTLVSVTQLWTALGRFEEATVLGGLALYHATAEQENRDDVEKLRPQLEAALGKDAVNAAFEQGKALDLQVTLADLLPELEALDEAVAK